MSKIRKKAKQSTTTGNGITLEVDFGDGEPTPVRVESLPRGEMRKLDGKLNDAKADARLLCKCCLDPETGKPAFDEEEDLEWLADDVDMADVTDGWHARLTEAIAYVHNRGRPPQGYRDERYAVIEEKARALREAVADLEIDNEEGADDLDDLIDQIVEFAGQGGELHESIATAAVAIWDLCEDLVKGGALSDSRGTQIRKIVDGIHDVAENIGERDGDKTLVKKA